MASLIPTKSPRLPASPGQPDRGYMDQLTNVLRLYFNQLDNMFQTLFAPRGGQYINNPYGGYQSNVTQTVATINTPTLIYLEVADVENGTYRTAGDGIHVRQGGVYNVQFSSQVTNADTQAHDAAIWFRINGVDHPYSNSVFTISGTHGGQPGYSVVAANFFFELVAEDYIEMWWSTNSLQVTLNTLPPITSPFTAPGAPAVVCTLSFVSSLLT
jgi:hypothetical protein